jgi:SAM-dependent methyltransferase
LGLYIGASPFIGFHLALSALFGRLFGLNRLLVYAAANISNPLVAPLLYAFEIQVGSWLRTGGFYSPSTIEEIRLRGIAVDILLGSVAVGVVLALLGTIVTYSVVRARGVDPIVKRLVEAASAPYLTQGIATWEFVRSKMRLDPVYLGVLQDGVLPQTGRLYDLGCGQGVMLSLLTAARDQFQRNDWPHEWPAPPAGLELYGIELRPRIVKRAREILGDTATIEERDLAVGTLPSCDAVLIFDVLHLMPRDAQERLLTTVRQALRPSGVLVLREADARGGWRFRMVRFGNRLVAILQGRRGREFSFRTGCEWQRQLEDLGLQVRPAATPNRTPFANVTLYARAPGVHPLLKNGEVR